MPSPTPPPAPVTTTVLRVEEPAHKPIQIPPSATRVPAVRKCASGAPSISMSGARSRRGIAGPPERGHGERDRARQRVRFVVGDPVVRRGGQRVRGDTDRAPLPPAGLQRARASPRQWPRASRSSRRPTCRWWEPRTPAIRACATSGRDRAAGHPPRRFHAALATVDPRRFVEIREHVRCDERRRQPRVHHLVDAAERVFGGRDRGADLVLGREGAVDGCGDVRCKRERARAVVGGKHAHVDVTVEQTLRDADRERLALVITTRLTTRGLPGPGRSRAPGTRAT